jgi:hypothetical protein
VTRAPHYRRCMIRSARTAAALLFVALAPSTPAQSPEYEPTGEVRFNGGGFASGASFSAERVVGPNVNMTRREDGGWAGDLRGHNLDLHLDNDRLSGPNVNLSFSQKGDKVTIEGLFFGQRVRASLDRKKFEARMGACSLDLKRLKVGTIFRGNFGCVNPGTRLPASGTGDLQLYGDATLEKPPLAQLTLALVAALLT